MTWDQMGWDRMNWDREGWDRMGWRRRMGDRQGVSRRARGSGKGGSAVRGSDLVRTRIFIRSISCRRLGSRGVPVPGRSASGFTDDHTAGDEEDADQREGVPAVMGQGGLPEGGKDDDLQGGLAVVPLAVLVGGFYLKGVGAGVEVGVGGLARVTVGGRASSC